MLTARRSSPLTSDWKRDAQSSLTSRGGASMLVPDQIACKTDFLIDVSSRNRHVSPYAIFPWPFGLCTVSVAVV